MIMTRDNKHKIAGYICIWETNDKKDVQLDKFNPGYFNAVPGKSINVPFSCCCTEFSRLFPGEKLPRKGSKTYISHLKLVRG